MAGSASIATSMPFPALIRPNVDSTVRSVSDSIAGRVAGTLSGSSAIGAPCGMTRTRSGGTRWESITIVRAVSVKTVTSVARWHSARSASAWRTLGSESTVCRVTTSGWVSTSASEVTNEPASPPKMPYSCSISTTSVPREASVRAIAG